MVNIPHLGYHKEIPVPEQEELVSAEASRITALITHSVIATILGSLLLVAPKSDIVFQYTDDLPGWPEVYSVLFVLSGVNLFIRVVWIKKTRDIWWSLIFLCVCYIVFGGLFLVNLGKWVAAGHSGPTPLAYPIALYFGFFALLLLQVEASKPAKKERRNGGSSIN
jgi:hypothetical protein